jgi:isoamylase
VAWRGRPDDREIEGLRTRQIKNSPTLTLLSVGTPILPAGDELRRTQNGNNNAYCRDDERFAFDWSLLDRHSEVHHFAKQLISFRVNRDLPLDSFDKTLEEVLGDRPIEWHGVQLNAPDWSEQSHSLAATTRLLETAFYTQSSTPIGMRLNSDFRR